MFDLFNFGTIQGADTAPAAPLFTGSTEFVSTIPRTKAITAGTYLITDKMSVAVWMKSTGAVDYLFYHGSPTSVRFEMRKNYTFAPFDKVDIAFCYDSITCKIYDSSIAVLDGNWHHIVATFDAGVVKLYIDGVEDTSKTTILADSITTIANASYTTAIASNAVPGSFTSNVKIAMASSWSTAVLTASDVTELYNGGLGADPSTLSLTGTLAEHWRMGNADEDAFPFIADLAGSRDITVTDGTFVADYPGL